MSELPNLFSEYRRLCALRNLGILDSAPETEFDVLVEAAARATGRPIALISLIDEHRQWFKARFGPCPVSESPREYAFCAHAIEQDELFEIADTHLDARFSDNPWVTRPPQLRSYAGVPLRLPDGNRVGTLCVLGQQPGALTSTQREVLELLAQSVLNAMRGRQARLALACSRTSMESEHQRLVNTLEGTRAATWEWNALTGETRINERWANLIGYSMAELGRIDVENCMERIHPDDRERSLLARQRHLDGHVDCYECELRIRHRSGRWVWVFARGRIMSRTPTGQPEWMFGTNIDITELKEREEALRRSEERLNQVGVMAGVGGWELDCETGLGSFSEQTYRLHGLPIGEMPPLDKAIDFFPVEVRPVIQSAFERCVSDGIAYDLELPFNQADGTPIWVRTSGHAVWENGRIRRVIGAIQDVTEAHRLKEKLARDHEMLRVTLQSIADAVLTTNALGEVEWLNPVAERMTGWSAAEARGNRLSEVFRIVDEESREPAADPVQLCLQAGQTVGVDERVVLLSRDGSEYGIEDSAAPIRTGSGELVGVVLVFHDVTEQRRLTREMTHRATHDALTGLPNRSEFESRLEKLVAAAREPKAGLHALLYIDLDQFKIVNDSCGHAEGDRLLQQVSQLLHGSVRASDLVARLGGDEFAMILENCPPRQARVIAQNVCELMEDYRFIHADRSFRVGASIGLVMIDDRWESSDGVLQAADGACYAAKEAGRNRVHVWAESDAALQERRGDMRWVTRLEHALEADHLTLYAQRILPLSGDAGDVIYAEVLLRLEDGLGGVIGPSAFMPAAERFHMAIRIDRYVLRKALAWLSGQSDPRRIATLAINLSGRSICDRAFHDFAFELLESVGPDICGRICLEITETVAVANLSEAAAFVQKVRKLGVRVALDDFGTGAATFGYLKAIPVDLIKIDGQFIRNIVDDPLDAAAVRSFAEVARVIGVKTVAEFVERTEVLEPLRAVGIDYIQGFLRHKPEPIDQMLQSVVAAGPMPGIEAFSPVSACVSAPGRAPVCEVPLRRFSA